MPPDPGPELPDLFLLEQGQQALAPLLAQRPRVWRCAPEATAKEFDSGLYLLSTVLDTLHFRFEVDSEAAMARDLAEADKRLARCAHEMRKLGEGIVSEAITGGLAESTAPARDHLARAQAAPCVHAGANRAVKISAEEYLIQCAECAAPAERLRVYKDSVSFSRRTGAVSAPYFPRERAAGIFSALERDGADAICAELERNSRKIIGYCPDCRVLYCPKHYGTQETWSGSWLESLHGTCAKGHRRELA